MNDQEDNQNNSSDPFANQGPISPPPPPVPPQSPVPPTPPTMPMPMAPNNGGYGYNQAPKNEPFAITSMVTGIVGGVFICCWPLAALLGAIATVFGALSLNKFKNRPNEFKGKGMAIAGLILGIIVIVIALIFLLLTIFGDASTFNNDLEFN